MEITEDLKSKLKKHPALNSWVKKTRWWENFYFFTEARLGVKKILTLSRVRDGAAQQLVEATAQEVGQRSGRARGWGRRTPNVHGEKVANQGARFWDHLGLHQNKISGKNITFVFSFKIKILVLTTNN